MFRKKTKSTKSRGSRILNLLLILGCIAFCIYFVVTNFKLNDSDELSRFVDLLRGLVSQVDESTIISSPVATDSEMDGALDALGAHIEQDKLVFDSPSIKVADNVCGAIINKLNSIDTERSSVNVREFEIITSAEENFSIHTVICFSVESDSSALSLYIILDVECSANMDVSHEDIRINNMNEKDSADIVAIIDQVLESSNTRVSDLFDYAIANTLRSATSSLTLSDHNITFVK